MMSSSNYLKNSKGGNRVKFNDLNFAQYLVNHLIEYPPLFHRFQARLYSFYFISAIILINLKCFYAQILQFLDFKKYFPNKKLIFVIIQQFFFKKKQIIFFLKINYRKKKYFFKKSPDNYQLKHSHYEIW